MNFTHDISNTMYDRLYDWLSVHTPGGYRPISVLEGYEKDVWSPVYNLIIKLQNNPVVNDEEKDFLSTVVYNGPIYRIQNYSARKKGYVYENKNHQSWSSSIIGISNVTNLDGQVLLIVGSAYNGISVFNLLCFLMKYKYITRMCKNPINLCRYEDEQEVTYPMNFESIIDIVAINKKDLANWKSEGTRIPKDKWKRNGFR